MKIIAVLHNIRSLHNVGSMFRTADAAGVSKIYLCGITPAPTDRFGKIIPQFAKVALGAEKTIPWESVKSPQAILKLIKNLKNPPAGGGYKILAVEQSKKSIPYHKFKFKHSNTKIVLIMGNEVKGLPRNILKNSDKILEIPMRGSKESLNVSVAFGVAIFGLLYK
jgi:tRNA G18 (ribose-2'-O)-methylase SpoU